MLPLTLRRIVLGLLCLGLLGSGADLLLLAHYEDWRQWIPLVLIALALVAVAVHLAGVRGCVRYLRWSMLALVAAGGVGVGLHLRGSAQFQQELDPTQPFIDMAVKALRAKAPPALAPAALIQIGLLGWAYCYRHPESANEPGDSDRAEEC